MSALFRSLLEEADQGGVDLFRTLLLNPMTRAFDDHLALQVRQHALQLVDALGADQAGDDGVLRTCDE